MAASDDGSLSYESLLADTAADDNNNNINNQSEGAPTSSADQDEPPPDVASTSNKDNGEESEIDDDNLLSDRNMRKMMIPTHEFMAAIQDPGKTVRNNKTGIPESKYSQIDKIAKQLWSNVKPVIKSSENTTRASRKISNCIVLKRQDTDVSLVVRSLHKYAKQGEEKMFVCNNDDDGGQGVIITMIVGQFKNKISVQKSKRDVSLAVRLCAVLCHPDNREAAKHFLSGKKHRGDMDQSAPVDIAFMQVLLGMFASDDFEVERPDVMDRDDHDPKGKVNPNECDYHGRDAKWLLDCWNEYVKPKLKKAYNKWWKETGGGPRTVENFINYSNDADRTYPFLTWIYVIDMKSDGLLSSNSGAKRPAAFAASEAGFENNDLFSDHEAGDEVGSTLNSFNTPSEGVGKKGRSGRKGRIAAQAAESQKSINKLVDLVEARLEKSEQSAKDHIDVKFEQIEKVDCHKRRVEDDADYSPHKKEKLIDILKKRKKQLGDEIIELNDKNDM